MNSNHQLLISERREKGKSFQPKKNKKENLETYKFLRMTKYAKNKSVWKRSRGLLSILISPGHCGVMKRWCVSLFILCPKKTLILPPGRAKPFIVDFLVNCSRHGGSPVVCSASGEVVGYRQTYST